MAASSCGSATWKRTWPQAAELHDAIRRLQDSAEILGVIEHALARIGQQSAPAG